RSEPTVVPSPATLPRLFVGLLLGGGLHRLRWSRHGQHDRQENQNDAITHPLASCPDARHDVSPCSTREMNYSPKAATAAVNQYTESRFGPRQSFRETSSKPVEPTLDI